ncbi:hypothetical protein SELMODRAFT_173762 [Selaginella moellendorffii]|uniref:Molybdenum cofactor sulfurase n=1 Tax=Selaginella moellendorffii TaxID=88036 RepID=D8RS51_SELML|nr:hypothetical protein SELMODRAFT_173762 [Selaginella moellendorffii]
MRSSTGFFYLPGRLLALILWIHAAVRHFLERLSWPPRLRQQRDAEISGNSRRQSFLKEFGGYYGYADGPVPIDRLRGTEFARLKGTIYLDHAGATLYSSSQLQEALADYSGQVYGNPHSQSDSSIRSSHTIESARQQVLEYFHAPASEYACVFTSGATAALKLVGETFPWSSGGHFCYTLANHNSVLGIREYALEKGATAIPVSISNQGEVVLESAGLKRKNVSLHDDDEETYNLFAMPTECNFSGAKFPMELVERIKDGQHMNGTRGRWMVLLDAAKSAGTSPPDLSRYPADFVVVSFYKIFGYPTGLGALIVRREAGKVLNQKYFGGGTVAVSIADIDYVNRRESLEQRMEDGTISFLSIRALRYGFMMLNRMGISSIARHTWALTHYTARSLRNLKHGNGAPVCFMFGNHGVFQTFAEEFRIQGPVITFNLKRADGSWVGHREVEKVASLCRIHLRTGCFCNPGACAKYLELSNKDMQANFEAGHVCWDDQDLISGRPTGAVRISFGYMSTFQDCQAFLKFVRKYFVETTYTQEAKKLRSKDTIPAAVRLKSIIVYPIKSCAGFSVEAWPIVESGLLYDREWMICDTENAPVTQKKAHNMCLITPSIDLASGKLVVRAPNVDHTLEIPLEDRLQHEEHGEVILCGQRAKSMSYGAEISEWFTKALGLRCNLVRKGVENTRVCRWRNPEHSPEGGDKLSFANEGQFLLLSEASVEDLNARIATGAKHRLETTQFRPNLVVSGGPAYEEDEWQSLSIGDAEFPVLGGCNRCQMITIDQRTGAKNPSMEPLATLASYRRTKGKILFGVLLGAAISDKRDQFLAVGSRVIGR